MPLARLSLLALLGVAFLVAPLRTVVYVPDPCCCPDPAYCQCPDHDPDQEGEPLMRSCGNSGQFVIAPGLPAFEAPAAIASAPPARAGVEVRLTAPHAPPDPVRPPGPS